MRLLIITADDYGYAPAYDRGIVEAAAAGMVDSVSAMVLRRGCEPAPLLATAVEIGLHLELDPMPDAARGGEGRSRLEREVVRQFERFERIFGRPAAYLDGHHHAHARPEIRDGAARAAAQRGLGVRSVDPEHRRLLRRHGVPTPDLLVGRLAEEEPALPAELVAGEVGPSVEVIEWMVHPGRPDSATGSGYDRGRGEDLALLARFEPPPGFARASHGRALAGEGAPPTR